MSIIGTLTYYGSKYVGYFGYRYIRYLQFSVLDYRLVYSTAGYTYIYRMYRKHEARYNTIIVL